MKIIVRIISIIIEITVAVAIFIMVTQKTPLFDRAIPGRGSGGSASLSTVTTNISEPRPISTEAIPISSGSLAIHRDTTISISQDEIASDIITDTPVSSGLSCTTPRGAHLSDGNSIIAYRTQRADTNNKCYSEIRICQDGKFGGSFVHQTCDYVIDGQLIKTDGTRQDIITGASNSEQKMINLSTFYKKLQSTPKSYTQPKPYKDTSTMTITQARGQKMDNSKIVTQQNFTDTLDQATTQEDHSTSHASCTTPRGSTLGHGSFIYAYNYPTNTMGQSCIVQKRTCSDGILGGSYRHPSCTFHTDNTTPQATIYAKASTLYRGTLSPYSPYVKSLSENIQDTILTSSANTAGTTDGQNYIKISNCLTPWGSTVTNGGNITAYRLPTKTHNSLCDSEIRVCRGGVLGGRYTYPSCDSAPDTESSSYETRVGRNIRSIGRDIHDIYDNSRAERNIESIGRDTNSVRGRVKGWFR